MPIDTTSNTPDALNVHLALNTDQLDHSIAFYRAFFGVEPVKRKPGYAKFALASPPLNMTLNERPAAARTSDAGDHAINHLGIQVDSTQAVRDAQDRLIAAGLITQDEFDTDCCHALQDKVWVHDPNGYAWEIFVVKNADTTPHLNPATTATAACCVPATCCAPA
ncbi:MAG: ArsI/CadI family heavy metal resistance metalloenzyme [Acidobacteriota bacterium]